jgi:isoleucyl-tRNA synthetase
MRAVAINPQASYSLVRHQDKTYISSTESVNKHPFFKSKKIQRIRKFMGQALVGISVENPVDDDIICPVVANQVMISSASSGIDAVCPLAYQDDLNLVEGVALDRKPIFDKYGRAKLNLTGKASSEGNST